MLEEQLENYKVIKTLSLDSKNSTVFFQDQKDENLTVDTGLITEPLKVSLGDRSVKLVFASS